MLRVSPHQTAFLGFGLARSLPTVCGRDTTVRASSSTDRADSIGSHTLEKCSSIERLHVFSLRFFFLRQFTSNPSSKKIGCVVRFVSASRLRDIWANYMFLKEEKFICKRKNVSHATWSFSIQKDVDVFCNGFSTI